MGVFAEQMRITMEAQAAGYIRLGVDTSDAVIFQFGNPQPSPTELLKPYEGDLNGTYRGVSIQIDAPKAAIGVAWKDFDSGHIFGGPGYQARAFLAKPLFLFPQLATAITHSRQTAAVASGRTLA